MEHARRPQAGGSQAIGPRSIRLPSRSRLAAFAARIGLVLALVPGCGALSPRTFRALNHPASVVRARSVGYGSGRPDYEVVPALIERLGDGDPVVRLTAHEELRRRTGQNFGYVPWASQPERAQAIEKWRAWWKRRQLGVTRARTAP